MAKSAARVKSKQSLVGRLHATAAALRAIGFDYPAQNIYEAIDKIEKLERGRKRLAEKLEQKSA